MPEARIWKTPGYEQTDLPILGRVWHDGALITQAAISSITCSVRRYPKATGVAAVTSTPTVVVASAVFDALQTSARWTRDATGYNFAFTVPAAAFAAPDLYTVVFTFTPVSGSAFPVICRAPLISLEGIS